MRNLVGNGTRTALAVAVIWALFGAVAAPATAQEVALTDEQIASLGTTAEDLAAVEPNDSWSDLGFFSDDALRVLEFGTMPVDAVPYAFGDDVDTPPVITPPGTQIEALGVVHTRVPDGWTPPAQGVTGQTAFGQTAPLAAGDDVMIVWVEYDSDFDFTSGLTLNEGITLAIPGLPVWNSAFEGDTWEGANVIPNAMVTGDGQVNFVVNRYEPPQSFNPVPIPAFYYRSGNVMAVGVSSDSIGALVAEGENQNASTATEGQTNTLLYTGDSRQVTAQEGTLPDWSNKTGGVGIGANGHTALDFFINGFVMRIIPQAITLLIIFVLIPIAILLLITATPPPASNDDDDEPSDEGDDDSGTDTGDSAVDDTADDPAVVDPGGTSDPGSGGLPWIWVFTAGVILMICGFMLRQLLGDKDDEEDEGDEEDPRDVDPPPVIYGEEIEAPDPDFAVFLVQHVADSRGHRSGDLNHTVVKPRNPYARHLGDYYVTVMQILGQGTDTAAPPPLKQDKITYSIPGRSYRMQSGTSRNVRGDGLQVGTTLRVGDDEQEVLPDDDKTYTERANYDAHTVEGSCVVHDKTVVRIEFVPAADMAVASHRYVVHAQSSMRLEFDPYCFMHTQGADGFSWNKGVENVTQAFTNMARGLINSICGTTQTADFEGPVRVECRNAGVDYELTKQKSYWSVPGKTGQLVEFGGPELEAAVGPFKLGKVGMKLDHDEAHAKKVEVGLEHADDGERAGVLFEGEIESSLSSKAKLVTNAGAMQRVNNRVSMIGDINHEMKVTAEGEVGGHKVSMALALGRPREARRWVPGANSELRTDLNSPAVPDGADGYITAPGHKADLNRDSWYYPARAGHATPALNAFIPWKKK